MTPPRSTKAESLEDLDDIFPLLLVAPELDKARICRVELRSVVLALGRRVLDAIAKIAELVSVLLELFHVFCALVLRHHFRLADIVQHFLCLVDVVRQSLQPSCRSSFQICFLGLLFLSFLLRLDLLLLCGFRLLLRRQFFFSLACRRDQHHEA